MDRHRGLRLWPNCANDRVNYCCLFVFLLAFYLNQLERKWAPGKRTSEYEEKAQSCAKVNISSSSHFCTDYRSTCPSRQMTPWPLHQPQLASRTRLPGWRNIRSNWSCQRQTCWLSLSTSQSTTTPMETSLSQRLLKDQLSFSDHVA